MLTERSRSATSAQRRSASPRLSGKLLSVNETNYLQPHPGNPVSDVTLRVAKVQVRGGGNQRFSRKWGKLMRAGEIAARFSGKDPDEQFWGTF
jgi:hypothetical protein